MEVDPIDTSVVNVASRLRGPRGREALTGIRSLRLPLAIALLGLGIGSCTDSIAPEPDPIQVVTLSLTLSLHEVTLRAGAAPVSVTAVVTDSSGQEVAGAVVEWTSTDANVASVDEAGNVTPLTFGETMVIARATASTDVGAGADTARVVVGHALDSVILSPDTIRLTTVGDTAALSAMVLDTEGGEVTGEVLTWSSAGSDVATVDENGLVTARGPGTTSIIASVVASSAEGPVVATAGTASVTVTLPGVTALEFDETSHPLVRSANISLGSPGTVEVLYWPDGGPILSVVSNEVGREHSVLLPRLRGGETYTVAAFPSRTRRVEFARWGGFDTDSLPPELANLKFVPQRGRPSHEVTMIEVPFRLGESAERAALIMIDPHGEIVWYRVRGPFLYGAARRANGDLAYVSEGGTTGGRVWVETIDGRVLNQLLADPGVGLGAHHDVIVTPDNTLLVLSFDPQEVDGETIVGEAIWEWNPDADELTKRWSSFDHLSVDDDWGEPSTADDWLHANSLGLGGDGSVLMSMRSVSQVISIAPDYGSIEYSLGGFDSPADIELLPDDQSQRQHTATELSRAGSLRRILLFDNGIRARGYSRALELEVDVDARTVRKVWEFVPPGNHAPFAGGARRLKNGNTFITMGSGAIRELYEVGPGGEVVWHLKAEGAELPILYRATPLESLSGEREVAFPASALIAPPLP